MVFLSAAGPLIIESMFKYLERTFGDFQSVLWPANFNDPWVRQQVMQWLPRVRESLSIVHRTHLVLFYFLGSHYEISKRVTGVNYVSI